MSIREIRIEDYNYELPESRIARYPLEDRDQSNLLVFSDGKISHKHFYDLPGLLPSDSMLIWNNTKVIPARLQFRKPTGALIEIFLLEPAQPTDYAEMFRQKGSCIWDAIVGNQKKWKGDALVRTIESPDGPVSLSAENIDADSQNRIFLKWIPENLMFSEIVDLFGKTPIPPYLKRDSEDKDKTTYQTVYADFDGSVAAPTAGLHFTPQLIDRLKQKNIRINAVTLHVGAGTFVPVKTKTIGDHQMHAETVIIEKSVIRDLLNTSPDKLTVVGTTSLRSLESLFWLGQRISLEPDVNADNLCVNQWDPYSYDQVIQAKESLSAILNYIDKNHMEEIRFFTRLIIVPGYQFKLVHRLITNFHQPSSTLLLLVSALIGDPWRQVYDFALNNDFRFLSYGDSSLLEMQPTPHG